MEPIVIGLTGGIACGKSTIARNLRRLGAAIIDADREAKAVVKKGSPAWKNIVSEFGEQTLNPDGSINRRRLGNMVFGDAKKLARLNEIIHPRTLETISKKIQRYKESGRFPAIVVDAALLFEAEATGLVDIIWVAAVDKDTQIKRLMERDKLDSQLALQRVDAQMPLDEKIARANAVIDNMGTRRNTREQIDRLWAKYVENNQLGDLTD